MATIYQGLSNRIISPAKDRLCCNRRPTDDSSPGDPCPVSDGDIRMEVVGIKHTVPKPSTEEELNDMFKEILDELGLHGKQREAMLALPFEKKWQIYCSKKTESHLSNSKLQTPEAYISSLNTFRNTSSPIERVTDERTETIENLKTALRTQPVSFLFKFLEMGGLELLLNFLRGLDRVSRQKPIHTAAISCIQNIMNDPEGRSHVLTHPNATNIISQSLITTNVRTKMAVLELLGATCLVPGGHRKVLQAMTQFQEFSKERTRFQTIVVDLDLTLEDYKLDVGLKTAIMSFINAIIRCGPGQTHMEFRLHLRYELLMLGIQSIIDKLRLVNNETLNRHIDFFEMVRNNDEKEFATRFSVSHIDSKSASSMFDLLRKRLGFGLAYPHFLSIFFHLLQLPTTGTRIVQYWQLVDRIIQQVAIQTKDTDADVCPLQIDVKKLVSQLTNEASIKEAQQKMREIEKTNQEISTKLAKKERECESKIQEKDELMQTLNKVKARYEKESSNYQEQINYLTSRVSELERLLEMNADNPGSVNIRSSLQDGSRFNDSVVSPSIDSPTELEEAGLSSSSLPPLPAPPPPPPPPPPPLTGLNVKTKDIPQPSQPLKSFNWTKLPENRIQGTIWKDIDDIKAFKILDLEDLEKNFSAYQRQDEGDVFGGKTKVRELTVIDGRRAQNCTIMLSKLKMTNDELTKVILSVDREDDLPRDMCEQLLKFVPTAEEVQMLSEHSRELNQMARADHFLFEMSRIDHYEDRLKALFFKKTFSERISATIPRIKDVWEASKQVVSSDCLKGILEIVLAFGNFMNRGQRGNASGFRISSLNKIVDTKSSMNKKATLLHYLAEVIEQKNQQLLNLEEELSNVNGAAKVKLTDLETEIGALRMGIKEIEKELEYQKQKPANVPGRDGFLSIMSDFLEVASCRFSDMDYDFREMKEKFDKCVELMGEEVKKIQPDEFFGIFDQFLNSLSEARNDNILWKKQKEEEEKKAKREAELREEREKMKTRSDSNLQQDKTGEMDDLIFALKSLEVFRDDVTRMKRTRNRNGSQILSPTSPYAPSSGTTSSSKDRCRPSFTTSSTDRVFMIS